MLYFDVRYKANALSKDIRATIYLSRVTLKLTSYTAEQKAVVASKQSNGWGV